VTAAIEKEERAEAHTTNLEKAAKFKDYFDWHEPVATAPSHRLLAMFRGENEEVIKLEINPNVKWDSEGQVGMARTSEPDSATSQFFISLAPAPFLNKSERSDGYALFGKVIVGMEPVIDEVMIAEARLHAEELSAWEDWR
jgi:cyclophilin family peptidyl-prolyl cis-trans isomerase